jgi:hypothetical protein
MAREIRTEIVIAAPAERVWEVLTDFASYPDWAPMFNSISGKLQPGERLRVSFKNGPTVNPVIAELQPARVLEWQGKLLVGGVFDGRHRFELQPQGDKTLLIHSERFTGVLIPLFKRLIDKTEQNFVAYNEALRARAEAAQAT